MRPAGLGLLTCGHNGADGRIYATLYHQHPKSPVVGFIVLKIFKARVFYVVGHRMYRHTAFACRSMFTFKAVSMTYIRTSYDDVK